MEEKNLLLDAEQLNYLLKSNADKIGNQNGWEPFITAFLFFVSSLFASYPSWLIFSANTVEVFVLSIACILMIRGLYLACKDKKYTYKDLYMEIKNQNKIKHPFSIIVIKDEFQTYPDHFLVYYDSRWKCRLFPNYHTAENLSQNEAIVKEALSRDLHLHTSNIQIDYKDTILHKKFSHSDQCEKWYEHTIYQAHISNFPAAEQSPCFQINGRQFYWMSLADMERDQTIQEKNGDIVSFIKKLIV